MSNNLILGGGASGVALAYYLKQSSLPFQLFEKNSDLGGNARTLTWGEHLYDTGAHRLHDQIPEVTELFLELLKGKVKRINTPSQIVWKGRRLEFPIQPLDLMKNCPNSFLWKAFIDWFWGRHFTRVSQGFAALAIRTYGQTIADEFLLNYTEKLWGRPSSILHPSVAGKRLKGLGLKSMIEEFLGVNQKKVRHVDGAFYYPEQGIGALFDSIESQLPSESLFLESGITQIHWDPQSFEVKEIEFESGLRREVHSGDLVWNTLAISQFVRLLHPAPPAEVLELLNRLTFRHLGLVVVKLSKSQVSPNASLYFADPSVPFNRLYEPSNRSAAMSPQGETLAVLEVGLDERLSSQEQETLVDRCLQSGRDLGLWSQAEELGVRFEFLAYAYPIPLIDTPDKQSQLMDWVSQFGNLFWLGRGAQFEYTHLHDHFNQASQLVKQMMQSRTS